MSDGEVLIARGVWFQICGAADEKARRPNSVFILETFRRDWPEERSRLLEWRREIKTGDIRWLLCRQYGVSYSGNFDTDLVIDREPVEVRNR